MADAEEVVEEYRSSLADLTINSKPLISMLTMLAEDHSQYAQHIVQLIEQHLQKGFTLYIFFLTSLLGYITIS